MSGNTLVAYNLEEDIPVPREVNSVQVIFDESLSLEDGGVYRCVSGNDAGNISVDINITVLRKSQHYFGTCEINCCILL